MIAINDIENGHIIIGRCGRAECGTMEKGERRIPELVQAAQQNGVKVACVHLRKPSLEDVFLHFTGRRIREQEASQEERNRAMLRARMGRRR